MPNTLRDTAMPDVPMADIAIALADVDWGAIKPCFEQPKQPNFPTNLTIELRQPGYAHGSSTLLFRFPAYDHADGVPSIMSRLLPGPCRRAQAGWISILDGYRQAHF